MKIVKLLGFVILWVSVCTLTIQVNDEFLESFTNELEEWVGFHSIQEKAEALKKCNFQQIKPSLTQFYKQLAQTGVDFSLQHIDVIRKWMKDNSQLKSSLKCFIDARLTQNHYFKEPKKYKQLAAFIKQQSGYSKGVFPVQFAMKEKGRLLGHFFKAFFQFYYMNVFNPSQTLSTEFIRSLTARSDIFGHLDISYCLSIDTMGDISTELQGLDINNIYQKLPRFWKAFKYLKFKERCKDDKHIEMAKSLQQLIGDIDIYRLMYHDYEPYVQIAAEKFGTAQIRMLAKKVAEIISNSEKYTEMAKKQF